MSKTITTWAANVLLSLAANQQAETRGVRFLRLATDARLRIQEIPVNEVRLAIEKHVKVIDVREVSEYRRGHLPSAIHLSRGIIEVQIERWVPDLTERVILYCGAGNRSALAADNLQKMGYTAVRVMAGGFRAWLRAGFPALIGSHLLDE